jgi:hypothetical protein
LLACSAAAKSMFLLVPQEQGGRIPSLGQT